MFRGFGWKGVSVKLLGVEKEDAFAHFLAGLELDDGAFWNRNFLLGGVRVAADAFLAAENFEDTEIAEFDAVAGCEFFGDGIESELDDVHDVILSHLGLTSDAINQFPFSHCHDVFPF